MQSSSLRCASLLNKGLASHTVTKQRNRPHNLWIRFIKDLFDFSFVWRTLQSIVRAFRLNGKVHFSHVTLISNGNGEQFCEHKTEAHATVSLHFFFSKT